MMIILGRIYIRLKLVTLCLGVPGENQWFCEKRLLSSKSNYASEFAEKIIYPIVDIE